MPKRKLRTEMPGQPCTSDRGGLVALGMAGIGAACYRSDNGRSPEGELGSRD
jgi:hypothetical protein